jgi:alpha-tubulin suppressor-like RCC1 family protein
LSRHRLAASLCLVLSGGCQQLTGLDADRPRDDPHAACGVEGARRCNLEAPEVCVDGRWTPDAPRCSRACVAGQCVNTVLSAGHHFTCLLRESGPALCWGEDKLGEIGQTTTTQVCGSGASACASTPTPVPETDRATYLSSFGHHSCVLVDDRVQCWGDNQFGQLGNHWPPPDFSAEPVATDSVVSNVASVRVGGGESGGQYAGHSCLLSSQGELWCWGANCAGQLGLGVGTDGTCPSVVGFCEPGKVNTNNVVPRPVPGIRFIQVSPGGAHTCALTNEGSVYCWGFNLGGQAAVDPIAVGRCTDFPHKVPGLSDIVQVASGPTFSCALDASGTAHCWGSNNKSQLGTPSDLLQESFVPVAVPGPDRFVQIAVGHGSTVCGLTDGAVAYCWGENENGECGVIDNGNPQGGTVQPQAIAPPTRTVDYPGKLHGLAVGGNHACALTADDAVVCWGQRDWGATGTSVDLHPTPPVVVPLGT